MASPLYCSESRCSWMASATTQSGRKQGLLRHLKATHLIIPTVIEKVCSSCDLTLGMRPGSHQCDPGLAVVENVELNHRCPYENCNFSFFTGKGLNNHVLTHRKTEAAARHAENRRTQENPAATAPEEPHISASQANRNQLPSNDTQPTSSLSFSQTPNIDLSEMVYPPLRIPSQSSPPFSQLSNLIYNESDASEEEFEDATENPVPPHDPHESSIIAPASAVHSQVPPQSYTENDLISAVDAFVETARDESSAIVFSQATPENSIQNNIENTQPHDDGTENGGDAATEEINQEVEEESPSNYVLDEFLTPLHEQCRETNWSTFETLLDEITVKIQQHQRIRTAIGQFNRNPIDTDDCKAIQRLYNQNRRRAVRNIIEGEGERCSISNIEVINHFTEIYQEKTFDPSCLLEIDEAPEDRTHASTLPFTEQEIKTRLAKAENTSPGDDKITYRHWRTIDPDGQALKLIFEICLKNKKIPSTWKASRTILIPKEGSPDDIKNWRPIALCRTIYKLYSSCLVQRLRTWATQENVFSAEQKGFMPHDGVVEHNFALQHYLNEARTGNMDICVALLDLSNAFGSIPTNLITSALEKFGIGQDMQEIIQDIMTGTSTHIVTSNGPTPQLDVKCGVRQGCPLSGFLFNAGIEPLIRAITKRGQQIQPSNRHHCLAYADDITLISNEQECLQELSDLASEICTQLGLAINPRKCVYMHWSGQQPRGPRDTAIIVQEAEIRALPEFENTKFLGKPVGFNILKNDDRLEVAIEKAKKILNCKLAPWQRLDALKTFILPSIIFPMRTWQYNKTQYEDLDRQLRPLIKKTLYLPTRSSNEYIYGSSFNGACGVPIAAEDSDLFLIDTAFKLLTSPDPVIKSLAEEDCGKLGAARLGETGPTPNTIPRFMNELELPRRSSAPQSLWTKARSASIRLDVKWTNNNNSPSLTFDDKEVAADKRREVASIIRTRKRRQRDAALLQKPDQGKTMHAISADKTSSSFIKDGKFTAFADWRFIHRGRLNLLPLNAAKRGQNIDKRCRRCGRHDETLPHVLNHCMRHSATMQNRHNELVNRIKDTARFMNWEILSENTNIPNSNLQGRPDLVITKSNDAIIIDVTCPFENGENAFERAREEKMAKYEEHARFLRRTYTNVKVEAFIVGSLGAYDPKNTGLTRRIATRSYIKTMKLLCVATCIKWSRMQYIEHITGARQY